jgi:hypothetical protein
MKMSEIFKLKTKSDKINKILYGGFSYTIQHKQRDNLRWKCSKKIKCKCDAVLCTSKDISNPKLIQHNQKIKTNQKNIRLRTFCEYINKSELRVKEFSTQVRNNIRTRPRYYRFRIYIFIVPTCFYLNLI